MARKVRRSGGERLGRVVGQSGHSDFILEWGVGKWGRFLSRGGTMPATLREGPARVV